MDRSSMTGADIIFPKVQECAARVFELPSERISREASADDLEQWDSLAHINLIAEVESEFGIRFSMEEIPALGSVAKLCEAVGQHLPR